MKAIQTPLLKQPWSISGVFLISYVSFQFFKKGIIVNRMSITVNKNKNNNNNRIFVYMEV